MDARAGMSTREALMRAGEQEMARHGVEGADLLRITRSAGQRNRAAVHYHFGSRAGLVDAILTSHRQVVNLARVRMLDRMERSGPVGLAGLVDALVQPTAAQLRDPSGRDYLVIWAEVALRAGAGVAFAANQPFADGLRRANQMLVERLDELPPPSREARVGRALLAGVVLLADLAREISRDRLTVAQARRQVPDVTAMFTGLLTAPSPDPPVGRGEDVKINITRR